MNTLFAQRNFNNVGNGAGPPNDMIAVFILITVGVFLIVGLALAITFLLTIQKALSRCHRDNRTMEPGQVWLNLIPCFSIVWQFITVNRVAESLDNEFYERRLDRPGEDYGRSLGTTGCVLNLLGAIPYIGALFGLAGLVCFILYWVKIAGFSKQLAVDDERGRYDDYDDRPKKRRQSNDYDDYDDDHPHPR